MIKKVKNAVQWTYVISDFNGKEIAGIFYERELQKAKQIKIKIEKVIN